MPRTKLTDEELTHRIDAALTAYMLERGRRPMWIRMSYETFQCNWGAFVKRDATGIWQWRGVPVHLRAMPLGEVECV